jgi:alanyl-tRNA synthetase
MTATPISSSSSSTTTHTAAEIRRAFIDFFVKQCGHTFAPSSPVIPHNDPTLLFTNAGMNQFKDVFLGRGSRDYSRAVNTQKCIRAGGKHNDLEDVGRDCYHHTFFEMLGNWSFGDYFKKDAINWAWTLLTEVWGIDPDRLYATYFEGNTDQGLDPDTEARDLWQKHLPKSHVITGDMKDNFWEMGETGPCGPCSEIHIDRVGGRDASKLVNADDPEVIELWNLVFIQFNRESAARLKALPAKHVDTGMGLERLVSVLQSTPGDMRSNYDTDLFTPLFETIREVTGATRGYSGKVGAADEGSVDTAYRVIADHARALTFAITDGAVPSNEGRGYVLRRMLRRAARFGRQMMGAETGFLSKVVPTVVEEMGDAFPELKKNPQRVTDVIREEEESFGRTLDKGIAHFEKLCLATLANGRFKDPTGYGVLAHATYSPGHSTLRIEANAASGSGSELSYVRLTEIGPAWIRQHLQEPPQISGEDAFQLYDTFGFPVDLTQMMAEERGLTVDIEGFERCMAEQRERSKQAHAEASGGETFTFPPDAIEGLRRMNVPATDDSFKYDNRAVNATVRAIWNGTDFDNHARPGRGALIGIVLNRTGMYAESGGQVADDGRLFQVQESATGARQGDMRHGVSYAGVGSHEGAEFKVETVKAYGGYVVHIGRVTRGQLDVGDMVQVNIKNQRRGAIRANHTATHLLNLALRKVLGEGVDQKGSLVADDRLRFDFPHSGPVSTEQLAEIEAIVREEIGHARKIYASLAPLEAAKKIKGLRAVFGEAYPDPVRVVSIGAPVEKLLEEPESDAWGELSIEFCGGTHLTTTDEAGAFAIVTETGIAKGVRRIEAVTGVAAQAAAMTATNLGARIDEAAIADDDDLPALVAELGGEIDAMTLSVSDRAALKEKLGALQDRLKTIKKARAKEMAKLAAERAREIAERAKSAGSNVIVTRLEVGGDRGALQQALKTIRDITGDTGVLLVSEDEEAGSVAVIAGVGPKLVERGLKAGDWVREVSQVLGGKGGGRPDQAQGGGADRAKLPDALERAKSFATERLTH